MLKAGRIHFKQILIAVGQGVAIALVISLLVFIFKDFLKAHIDVVIMKAFMTSVVQLFKVMTLVFIIGGLLMILLIHWVGWENIKFKIAQSRYRSAMYAKDYYKEYKRVKYENFIGDIARFHDSKLEMTGTELDERLVGTAKNAPAANAGATATYRGGKLNGVVQTHHSDGSLASEISYKNGIYHGPYITYYPNGRTHNEKYYRDGKLNGTFKAWDEDGHLFFEIDYKENKQHGVDKIYYRSGVLQFEDTYVNGRRTQRKTFDEGGRLKFVQEYH